MTVAKKEKVLVLRPDRIGDVVLSTPVVEALSKTQRFEVDLLVRGAVLPVVQFNPFVDSFFVYSPETTHKGLRGFFRLWKELRQRKYDTAVTLQTRFRLSLALVLAGVRKRIGPYSKWYSYLFFNKGARQSRSNVEMHESDYNLMLLRALGVRVGSRKIEPQVMVDGEAKERVRELLKKDGLDLEKSFVVVHPGMGGSALNWPEGYYIDLVHRMILREIPVVISGGYAEQALVERVRSQVAELLGERNPKLNFLKTFTGAASQTGLSDFIALLSLSKLVVAPSTGPLHLATALGKRTVSFFSPIKVQSALRWGPYVQDESKHVTLVPDALCGQEFKCAGAGCTFYFCMERLSVDEAVKSSIQQWEASL